MEKEGSPMGFFIPFSGHTQIYAREEVIWKKEEQILSLFFSTKSFRWWIYNQ